MAMRVFTLEASFFAFVVVATQFLTHILINLQKKPKNSKKTMKTPKNAFLIYLYRF
jgi:hypothetical protein